MFILPQDAAAVAFWAFGDPGPARPWASEGGRFSACFFGGGARRVVARSILCLGRNLYVYSGYARSHGPGHAGPERSEKPGLRAAKSPRRSRVSHRPHVESPNTYRAKHMPSLPGKPRAGGNGAVRLIAAAASPSRRPRGRSSAPRRAAGSPYTQRVRLENAFRTLRSNALEGFDLTFATFPTFRGIKQTSSLHASPELVPNSVYTIRSV